MPFELFPRNDPELGQRLRRQLMSLASYLMFLVPLAYAAGQGWTDFGYAGLAWIGALAIAVNLVFFVAIRSGWSLRFHDPGLTFVQIMVAMAMALFLIHHGGQARSVLLMLFVAALFFGVFALDTRQFLMLGFLAVAGYGGLIAWEFQGVSANDSRLELEILQLVTLAMLMLWMTLLGGYVARLRRTLQRSNAELDVAMARLRKLVAHDELTGVYNRRHLMDILHREQERAVRYGEVFSVCIIDLDHFKRVNDTHGHAAGDDVLRGFAKRMLACARKIDWLGRQDPDNAFGRYGGEEFLLVMPQTPLAGGRVCVERIRETVLASPFETLAGPIVVTFSAGLAQYRPGEDVAATLQRADEALYRAKANGRARTELALP